MKCFRKTLLKWLAWTWTHGTSDSWNVRHWVKNWHLHKKLSSCTPSLSAKVTKQIAAGGHSFSLLYWFWIAFHNQYASTWASHGYKSNVVWRFAGNRQINLRTVPQFQLRGGSLFPLSWQRDLDFKSSFWLRLIDCSLKVLCSLLVLRGRDFFFLESTGWRSVVVAARGVFGLFNRISASIYFGNAWHSCQLSPPKLPSLKWGGQGWQDWSAVSCMKDLHFKVHGEIQHSLLRWSTPFRRQCAHNCGLTCSRCH